LHDVGLDVIGLIRLRLLPLGDFDVLRFLDFEVALRLRLARDSVSAKTPPDRPGPGGSGLIAPGTLDGRVAVGFRRDVGVALYACASGLPQW
jgi:hypothetical protein